jgi:dTDP-4-amino-4,6-dideoxygalactose transaminase
MIILIGATCYNIHKGEPAVKLPAILGGEAIFSERINIVAPKLPPLAQIEAQVSEILRTGALTNNSRYVREFENALVRRFDVPYAIAVSNATLGLILTLQGVLPLSERWVRARKAGYKPEIILPSFTYCATAHAAAWCGLNPVFVDILPDTFTIDPKAVEAAITPCTVAILAVHIYGHPCEIDALHDVSHHYGLPLIYDSAHAFGSRYRGRPIAGFGQAEVFSFHATKLFPVGEGGAVATQDSGLAEFVGLARKFGDPGDENTQFSGLNAKMQEFNAILGLAALQSVDSHIANRRKYASMLIERLGRLPGITFQAIRSYVFMNYQNFAVVVDPVKFGLSRDSLFTALMAENIAARKYFYPPLHHHRAYEAFSSAILPVTEMVADRILCLPFYSEMSEEMLDGICLAFERIYHYFAEI